MKLLSSIIFPFIILEISSAALFRGSNHRINHNIQKQINQHHRVLCKTNRDCPEIYCFAPPCDYNVCENGACSLTALSDDPTDRFDDPPDNGDDNLIDTENNNNNNTFNETSAVVTCGSNICPVGQICCNDSCGHCAPPDGYCSKEFCLEDPVVSNVSRWAEVTRGDCYCQHASCSICNKILGLCVKINCNT